MHRIRLRGPWQVLSSGVRRPADDPPSEVQLPGRWGANFGDALLIRIARRFGCPSDLDPTERVWLALRSEASGEMILNESQISEVVPGTVRFDITEQLNARNRLELQLVRLATQEDLELPEVWLEIDAVSEAI